MGLNTLLLHRGRGHASCAEGGHLWGVAVLIDSLLLPAQFSVCAAGADVNDGTGTFWLARVLTLA